MAADKRDISDRLIKGMNNTIKRLIQERKEKNLDVVFSENGKVVRKPARDL